MAFAESKDGSLPFSNCKEEDAPTATSRKQDSSGIEPQEILPASIQKAACVTAQTEGESAAVDKAEQAQSQSEEKLHVKFMLSRSGTIYYREEWIPLRLGQSISPAWNIIKSPPKFVPLSYPPENTIQYSMDPTLALFQDLTSFCKDLGLEIIKHIRGSRLSDARIIPRMVRRGIETYLHIYFSDQGEAASFSKIAEIQWTGKGVEYKIERKAVGSCHPKDLLTLHFDPSSKDDVQSDSVDEGDYLNAIHDFLQRHLIFTPLGIWRLHGALPGYPLQAKETVALLVRRPAAFDLKDLAGFWRSDISHCLKQNHKFEKYARECKDGADSSDEDDEKHIWFRIDYGGRQKYCRVCKLYVHDWKTCEYVNCFKCLGKGHIAAVCLNPTQLRKRCRNCNRRGHLKRDCPYKIQDDEYEDNSHAHRKRKCRW